MYYRSGSWQELSTYSEPVTSHALGTQAADAAAAAYAFMQQRADVKWCHGGGRHLEPMKSYQKSRLHQSMCINLKNNPAKFKYHSVRNNGALGF